MHDDALTEGDSLQPRLLRFHGHGQVAQEQGAFKASELGHNRGGRRAAYVLRVAGPAPRQVYHPLPQGSTRQASIAWAADVPCARTIWPASESNLCHRRLTKEDARGTWKCSGGAPPRLYLFKLHEGIGPQQDPSCLRRPHEVYGFGVEGSSFPSGISTMTPLTLPLPRALAIRFQAHGGAPSHPTHCRAPLASPSHTAPGSP